MCLTHRLTDILSVLRGLYTGSGFGRGGGAKVGASCLVVSGRLVACFVLIDSNHSVSRRKR